MLAVGVGLIIFGAGSIDVMAGPNGTGGGPTAERIIGSGSDTTIILMEHMDGLYTASEGCFKFNGNTKPLDFSCVKPDDPTTIHTENYEHDQMSQADFIGSSTGISQLCKQGQSGVAYIDYARSSRTPKASDCTGLHFVAYARDGISVESFDDGTINSGINGMVNPDAVSCPAGSGFCLSQTQLKSIYGNPNCFQGTPSPGTNSWANFGGQNLPIQIYTPQSGSGTRSQFETFLGITDSTACITYWGQSLVDHTNTVPENQNSGIKAADKLTFIFPFSFAIWSTEINNTAATGFMLAKIDGVAPSSTTIANGTFPYNRFVFNVFCTTTAAGTCGDQTTFPNNHKVTQKTADFIGEEGWICKIGANEPSAGTWNSRTDLGVPTVDNDPANENMYATHVASPHFGINWQLLIQSKITHQGFGPLSVGAISLVDTNSDHCRLQTT